MSAPVTRRDNPWYVETFLAIGGWIAGLLAAGAIGAFVALLFQDYESPRGAASTGLAIGLGFVAAGSMLGRAGVGDFRRHFSVSMIAAGLTAATLASWYLIWSALDGDGRGLGSGDAKKVAHAGLATALLFIPVAGLAARTVKDGILTFLTTSAWFWIVGASLVILGGGVSGADSLSLRLFPPMAALIGLVIFTQRRSSLGAVGAALLIAPMLFYESMRSASGLLGGQTIQGGGTPSALAFAAGAVWCLALLRNRYPLFALLAATALIVAGIWFLPDAGAIAILILLAGMAAGHRGLAAVGVVALTWFIGKFYNDLSMSLLQKSAVLAGLGGATLLGALAARRLEARPAPTASAGERRSIVAALAFGALLAGALGLVNRTVVTLESDFGDARSIFLPLGPVDPRSILQGDYMILAFDETIYPEFEKIEALPERGEIFLKLDADGVAAFSRVAKEGDAPGPDEIRLDYVRRGGNLSYCPDSYFFQEGEADLFAPARFAVLKVAPDGKTRLVALADENRKIIEPPPR